MTPEIQAQTLSKFEDEILSLADDYDHDHLTRSDLQAAVGAIVLKIARAAREPKATHGDPRAADATREFVEMVARLIPDGEEIECPGCDGGGTINTEVDGVYSDEQCDDCQGVGRRGYETSDDDNKDVLNRLIEDARLILGETRKPLEKHEFTEALIVSPPQAVCSVCGGRPSDDIHDLAPLWHVVLGSSNIRAIAYVAALRQLQVMFLSGEIWGYTGTEIDEKFFERFLAAESAGKFFHAHIRRKRTDSEPPIHAVKLSDKPAASPEVAS